MHQFGNFSTAKISGVVASKRFRRRTRIHDLELCIDRKYQQVGKRFFEGGIQFADLVDGFLQEDHVFLRERSLTFEFIQRLHNADTHTLPIGDVHR